MISDASDWYPTISFEKWAGGRSLRPSFNHVSIFPLSIELNTFVSYLTMFLFDYPETSEDPFDKCSDSLEE